MRILFFAAHYGYYRNFESAIVSLAERGHHIHLAADERESLGGQPLVERLAARYPAVTFGFAPSLDDDAWFLLARKLRTASDYIRFHDEAFSAFRKTRLTLRDRIPRIVLWLMDRGLDKSRSARRVLGSALRASEAIMPISAASRAFIGRLDPDVVLITSMTAWRLPQIDHLRAARVLGRRTGVCVFSWDHLSSKALLRNVPDRVLLWNETQKQEALEWHGMPEERITITGAQCYDQWFNRPPSRDRASFCHAVGLSPEQPILLYVCSVMTPNPYESRFVQRWIDEIRRNPDPRLRSAGILVRPHPERMEEWEGLSLEGFGNAVLYGRNPVSPQAQDDYFDSLYHSHAVVGLVTSAFLEAAIVGRPVHTLLLPEFDMYQEGVQHFRYLMEVEGGLLKVTRTFPDHLAELSAALARPVERDEQNRRFVRAFVRPAGLDVPATPAFVDAVEQLGSSAPSPADVPGLAHRALQPLVRAIAQSSEHGWLRPALRDASEMAIDHARARKAAHKQAAAEDRERRVADKREFLATRRRERQRQHWVGARRKQLARIKGRLQGLVGSPSVRTVPALLRTLSAADEVAYATYLRARDEVVRLKEAASAKSGEAAPSHYWEEELERIDYLFDASPLIIRKLRHHAEHVTGIRPYDYRGAGQTQTYFERRVRALVELAGGTDLLVGEHEALGGFGFHIDGRLHNLDTLKFFETLVGMRRAGLLDAFHGDARRGLVWEIGGGWGGFAYQFKTLFPQTTYVILDFPELFLFSATYLATVFPTATIRFWREDGTTFDRWEEADFIFIPNHAPEALGHVRPDLLVNLVSFHEMTTAQVEKYTGLAASIDCPAVYSLNRDRSRYNNEIESVSAILARHYDLREIQLLGSDYPKAMKKDSDLTRDEAKRTGRLDPEGYRHLAGALKREHAALSAPAGAVPVPLVGIGMPLHNRATFLTEAMDSLLAQSYEHFSVVLVDDGSTDGTEVIARGYERRDQRVRYIRFADRRGMVAAWRSAFEYASADGATYFAWGSDHDRWHARWLATLVETLEQHPDVVLAYPLTQRIDPLGMPLSKPARQFETFGIAGRDARWTLLNRSDAVAAGDIVYGLMRTEAVRDAGVFRPVLCPDRLLVAELTLQGEIRQVPEVLWYRRQFETGSIERQRSTLFAPETRPPSRLTPPWYMHARSLWDTYGRRSHPRVKVPRGAAVRLILQYSAAHAWRHYAKSSVQHGILNVLGWPRWIYKRVKHAFLLGVYGALVALRQVGVTPLIERVCERLTGRPRPWRGHA